MPCSPDLWQAARALCPAPLQDLTPAGRGGNARLYRLTTSDGPFALKAYPPPTAADPRDRQGQEAVMLAFCAQHGLPVPRPLAQDRQRHLTVMDWIDGTPVTNLTPADIDSWLEWLNRLADLAQMPAAATLPIGSEAVFTSEDLLTQITSRLTRLEAIAPTRPDLAAFLDQTLRPALVRHRPTPAGPFERTVSPSDFGSHNMLRRPDGSLVLLDLEYAGWDDPAKLLCDTLLHPGMGLPADLGQRFRTGFLRRWPDTVAARVDAYLPLYRLRWALIMLNEFLPERWATRRHAGAADWEAARVRQLAKAERMLIDGS